MIRVVAGIAQSGGRYFVARRSAGEWRGFWEFPGGKVDSDEGDVVALRREIKEELCVEATIDTPLVTAFHPEKPWRIAITAYRICFSETPQSSAVHDQLRWCTLGELSQLNLLPADAVIFECLRDQLAL